MLKDLWTEESLQVMEVLRWSWKMLIIHTKQMFEQINPVKHLKTNSPRLNG